MALLELSKTAPLVCRLPEFPIQSLISQTEYRLPVLLNYVKNKAGKLQIAGFTNINGVFDGLQIAGFTNINDSSDALQIAGFSNISRNTKTGLQLSGFFNTGGDLGMQIAGFFNKAANVRGVQIAGFFQ